MSTRTDALLSQQETGKMTASISPRYDRLSPGAIGKSSHSEGVPKETAGVRTPGFSFSGGLRAAPTDPSKSCNSFISWVTADERASNVSLSFVDGDPPNV